MYKRFFRQACCLCAILATVTTKAQVLTLQQAVQTGLDNYESIKAKANYVKSSEATVQQVRKEALPNLVLSAQQDYGTVNGQNGPLYGYGGFATASSGIPLSEQNWNAAFGALYLTNINWEFYTFGRVKQRIRTAESTVLRDKDDQTQEQFQHQIKVAAAYLNLLAAQRLTRSQQNNLSRADSLKYVVTARAKNGLIPGVDSSLANAEISNATILLIRAKDAEQERSNQLAQLMGIAPQEFVIDTLFINHIPATMAAATDSANIQLHPLLQYYKSRINVSNQQARFYDRQKYPSLNLWGILQTRGSGFKPTYNTDPKAFTHDYFDGINPTRTNYLLGIGATWNLTSLLRVKHQVASQYAISAAMQNEYNLVSQQITAQAALADTKIKNALTAYNEVPRQIKAAGDAFLQKTVMYRNGLSNMVDVTQALYALNRAETDRDIQYTNVWQALLLKAAASGDFSLFSNAIQ